MKIFFPALVLAASLFPQITALDFPGTNDANRAFRRTLQQGLPNPYPLTVIWQAWVLHKSPEFYQTCWFYGGRSFYSSVSQYYGCCPYPSPSPNGPIRWEIAIDGGDETGDLIEAGRWYTCAFRAWSDGSGKHHEFYYDVPNASKRITYDRPSSYFSSTNSDHEICWGDAQWDHVRSDPPSFGGKESLKGRMRRFKIITASLSPSDLMAEAQSDELITTAAKNNIWYYNANPRPDDIEDKSGKGHHFTWYDPGNRAGLWTGPSTAPEPAAGPTGRTFTISPNPARASAALTLLCPALKDPCRISLFNPAGGRQARFTAETSRLAKGLPWNPGRLSSGVYLIELESDGARFHSKVLLTR